MTKNKGLGRGLDSLFGEESHKEEIQGIKINDIEPNPNQPRRTFDDIALEELADSIRENGVVTPITVRKTGSTYQIIAGERRWRACRIAGLTHIPAYVVDVEDKMAYQMALVENLQREDLNPIEEAKGYQSLMDNFSFTQELVSQKVGKSRSAVANSLRLLALPVTVRSMLEEGLISEGHGRALLGLSDQEAIENAARTVIRERLNVRQTEELVKKYGKRVKEKENAPEEIYVRDLEHELESLTGLRVTINHGKKKGRLSIEYYGNDDLEDICNALKSIQRGDKND